MAYCYSQMTVSPTFSEDLPRCGYDRRQVHDGSRSRSRGASGGLVSQRREQRQTQWRPVSGRRRYFFMAVPTPVNTTPHPGYGRTALVVLFAHPYPTTSSTQHGNKAIDILRNFCLLDQGTTQIRGIAALRHASLCPVTSTDHI